ncbi:peptidylprolyl isomerase [Nostocoides sp. F2B08]|uniref:peptidylprolyl isomerase n=1 Tax=Nostocoides sp. F2B08 TaxID=2653936 RepID=UPI00126362E1|nr:peptidylprolyl isomerase [Tetrasphaera sp. F2B08]KAB7743052.1 peptidylprolyl isomerase [Tetrasphaera sp. F2B08]
MSTRNRRPARAHKATQQQQRDRARRRAARREKAAATRRTRRRRTLYAVLAALAVLALVLVVVVLVDALGSDPPDETTPAAVVTTTPTVSVPDNCTPAPPAPGTEARLELPPPEDAAGRTFEAVVTTNCGDIVIELDGTGAPQTVASFLQLSRLDFYRDSPCHRLLDADNIVLQCGDPTGTGQGGPGYGFGVESVPDDGRYPRGTVAMARTSDVERGTGSQFFIVAADSSWPPEDGGYTIFGNVTSGMEIIDQVVAAGVDGGGVDGAPALPLSILRIAVTEKKV